MPEWRIIRGKTFTGKWVWRLERHGYSWGYSKWSLVASSDDPKELERKRATIIEHEAETPRVIKEWD